MLEQIGVPGWPRRHDVERPCEPLEDALDGRVEGVEQGRRGVEPDALLRIGVHGGRGQRPYELQLVDGAIDARELRAQLGSHRRERGA